MQRLVRSRRLLLLRPFGYAHQPLVLPLHQIISRSHQNLSVHDHLAFIHLDGVDIRGRTLPHHIKVKRDQTNPAFNPGMIMNDHIKPMKKWRADETADLKNDFTNLKRLVQRTRNFPNLRLLYIDKRPPTRFINPPVSMPIDVAKVFEVGTACETPLGFLVTGKEIRLRSKKKFTEKMGEKPAATDLCPRHSRKG